MSDVKPPAAPEAPAPPSSSASPTQSPGRAYLAEKDRTMSLKGKAYLQVADRVWAWRLDNPAGTITTEVAEGGLKEGYVVFRAAVYGNSDPFTPEKPLAVGHKTEAKGTFADWYEKAETGAIGRALGLCGYGTLAALEEDPSHPCDSPRPAPPGRPAPPPPAAAPKVPAKPAAPAESLPNCVVCDKPMDNVGRVRFCESKNLPPSHLACAKDAKATTPVKKGE